MTPKKRLCFTDCSKGSAETLERLTKKAAYTRRLVSDDAGKLTIITLNIMDACLRWFTKVDHKLTAMLREEDEKQNNKK